MVEHWGGASQYETLLSDPIPWEGLRLSKGSRMIKYKICRDARTLVKNSIRAFLLYRSVAQNSSMKNLDYHPHTVMD